VNDWSNEETDNPLLADDHNYYKVEKWTKDTKIERMLYAGNDLEQQWPPTTERERKIDVQAKELAPRYAPWGIVSTEGD
jgi:hypothetical protein